MSITGEWDRRISRRTLLKTGGSFTATVTLAGVAGGRAFAQSSYPSTLGVASGDPSPTGAVLWTRLAPDPLAVGGGLPAEPYEVRYEVAKDEGFQKIIRNGSTVALPEEAHSVRVELNNLAPRQEFFYRFKAGNDISRTGRTRTAPPGNADGRGGHVRVRVVPELPGRLLHAVCGRRERGRHRGDHPPRRLHLRGPASVVRAHAPLREIMTLDEYRVRHGQYKTDAHLQAAHAAHPWLVTWDDHEFDNNYANLEMDPEMTVEQARARRAAAYQAYWEHMPLSRARKPVGPDLQLYRRFTWGQQATFNVLGGRQYRSDQIAGACTPVDSSGYCADVLRPDRTMLGAEQRAWLFEDLTSTKARWNVIAQQTAFAPRNTATDGSRAFAGRDNWDGYVAERQLILDWLVAQGTPNPVVLTGDSHQHWLRNVPPHYSSIEGEPVATEFMGASVSTGGDRGTVTRFGDDPNNPHILFQNNNCGYVRCTLTPELWTSEYRTVDQVTVPESPASTKATFVVENGRAGAVPAGS